MVVIERGENGLGRRTRALGLGMVVLLAACGEAVREESQPEERDVAVAMEEGAEPELADRPDGSAVETPGAPATERRAQSSPPPPPAAPPAATSPVRGVPPQAAEAVEEEAEEVEPAPPPMREVTASAGSEIVATLNQELSTRTNQPGDRFTLSVQEPLIDHNMVIVQRNALIRGEVTAVQKSGNRGEAAIIKVAILDVTFNGDTWPLAATVVEAQPKTEGRLSTGDKAARIGAGAVAGAIIGRVIGGNAKGTVIGAAVGAAAGTAITLQTEDVDAVLPQGTVFRLRLDEPLTISVPGG